MKTLLVRLGKSISIIAFPAVALVLPTYPLPVQVGYTVLLLLVAHGSVEQWRSPEASRADRVVAALAISGVVLSGVVFILIAASMLQKVIHRPSVSTTPLA